MAYINVIGRLGGDPEVSYSSKGTKLTKFGVAENVYRGNGQEEQTIWYNVVLFGDTSAQIITHLKKGSLVQVHGQYTPREWEDKTTGQKRVAQEIVAHHIGFVPGTASRNEGGQQPMQPGMQSGAQYGQQAQMGAPAQQYAQPQQAHRQPMQPQPQQKAPAPMNEMLEEDEELPF